MCVLTGAIPLFRTPYYLASSGVSLLLFRIFSQCLLYTFSLFNSNLAC